MAGEKITIRLFITPQTNVRVTKDDKKWFRIPEDELIERWPDGYKRKMRILRYFQYKNDLRIEARRQRFELPTNDVWIKFYLPMPRSWSKKKKLRHDFEPHQTRPDASNLHKAFEDALKIQDMTVWDYRVSKFWYNQPKGYIEIILPHDYVYTIAEVVVDRVDELR